MGQPRFGNIELRQYFNPRNNARMYCFGQAMAKLKNAVNPVKNLCYICGRCEMYVCCIFSNPIHHEHVRHRNQVIPRWVARCLHAFDDFIHLLINRIFQKVVCFLNSIIIGVSINNINFCLFFCHSGNCVYCHNITRLCNANAQFSVFHIERYKLIF